MKSLSLWPLAGPVAVGSLAKNARLAWVNGVLLGQLAVFPVTEETRLRYVVRHRPEKQKVADEKF